MYYVIIRAKYLWISSSRQQEEINGYEYVSEGAVQAIATTQSYCSLLLLPMRSCSAIRPYHIKLSRFLDFCLRKQLICEHKTSTHISPWRCPLELNIGDHTGVLVSCTGRSMDAPRSRDLFGFNVSSLIIRSF